MVGSLPSKVQNGIIPLGIYNDFCNLITGLIVTIKKSEAYHRGLLLNYKFCDDLRNMSIYVEYKNILDTFFYFENELVDIEVMNYGIQHLYVDIEAFNNIDTIEDFIDYLYKGLLESFFILDCTTDFLKNYEQLLYDLNTGIKVFCNTVGEEDYVIDTMLYTDNNIVLGTKLIHSDKITISTELLNTFSSGRSFIQSCRTLKSCGFKYTKIDTNLRLEYAVYENLEYLFENLEDLVEVDGGSGLLHIYFLDKNLSIKQVDNYMYEVDEINEQLEKHRLLINIHIVQVDIFNYFKDLFSSVKNIKVYN